MPVVTNKAYKEFNLGVSVWRWTLSNGLEVLLGRKDPFFAHVMSEIVDLCFEHFTFGRFQFETMLSKVVKDHTHPFQMLFFCL